MNTIKASRTDTGQAVLVKAEVLDGQGQVLVAHEAEWGKDVPSEVIAAETRLSLQAVIARSAATKQSVPIAGLDGETL